jgi:hypothetical protein
MQHQQDTQNAARPRFEWQMAGRIERRRRGGHEIGTSVERAARRLNIRADGTDRNPIYESSTSEESCLIKLLPRGIAGAIPAFRIERMDAGGLESHPGKGSGR